MADWSSGNQLISYYICSQGIQAPPEKFRAITSLPQPPRRRALRRVLHWGKFYRRFIRSCDTVHWTLEILIKWDRVEIRAVVRPPDVMQFKPEFQGLKHAFSPGWFSNKLWKVVLRWQCGFGAWAPNSYTQGSTNLHNSRRLQLHLVVSLTSTSVKVVLEQGNTMIAIHFTYSFYSPGSHFQLDV